ncbi:hypothetical protein PFFCH_02036 [Plasmodium falciparum FCH/4]|uniref:Uncharacterized protein n=1 Tax=Plasmodium falciparum FCH/4 TaxID=1036724 RepID=A0A024VQQ4_PLAFA|nr:hypothetical protein PFFCH_02036 [Plasmodium falciparum FCH/4]
MLDKIWKNKVFRLLGENSHYFKEYNNHYNTEPLLYTEESFRYIQEPTEHNHVHSHYTQQHSKEFEETTNYEQLLPYYIQEQPEISHSFSYHIEQPLDVISQFQNNVYELSNIPNEFNFNYHNVKPREDQFYNNINTFLHHYPKEHNNIQTLQNSTKNEEFYDKANKNIQENFYNDFVKFKDYIINDKDQNIEDINITGEDKEKLKIDVHIYIYIYIYNKINFFYDVTLTNIIIYNSIYQINTLMYLQNKVSHTFLLYFFTVLSSHEYAFLYSEFNLFLCKFFFDDLKENNFKHFIFLFNLLKWINC